jgi:hypothetical protein
MINYPEDGKLSEVAAAHGLPLDVLVRDLVRVVEVCNLIEKGFFNKRSVLAGSMALRSFGSPRFTVYDADFSTSKDTVHPPTQLTKLLSYEDEELIIAPERVLPSSDEGSVWRSAPVNFTPLFTDLVQEKDCNFKADVSFRGLVRDGLQVPLTVPYEDLNIWTGGTPTVYVMDPVEVIADKILGWCVYGLVKHYADLGYLSLVSRVPNSYFILERDALRETAAEKLDRMRALHPDRYAPFHSLESLVTKLSEPVQIDRSHWGQLLYLERYRQDFTPAVIEKAVREILVPLLM